MPSLSDTIRARAAELHTQGLTKHQTLRTLKREFRHAERDMLVNAARLPGYHTRCTPPWAVRVGYDGKTHPDGAMLHPVTARHDPRKFRKEKVVVITIDKDGNVS